MSAGRLSSQLNTAGVTQGPTPTRCFSEGSASGRRKAHLSVIIETGSGVQAVASPSIHEALALVGPLTMSRYGRHHQKKTQHYAITCVLISVLPSCNRNCEVCNCVTRINFLWLSTYLDDSITSIPAQPCLSPSYHPPACFARLFIPELHVGLTLRGMRPCLSSQFDRSNFPALG
ncbi:hypothetical protein RRG08_063553 [Elysia crispata]|uniref:Uncharacterized protein n=1 Tax=Elysia crispata TaxID=231223 RepID=A0AAE0YPJ5_9GAST|nr:hypothetical protein RRG08_063553 [Elysia crispata]